MEESRYDIIKAGEGNLQKSGRKADGMLVPVGARVIWHLTNKEYTKVNDEKPFAKWSSLTGGTLLIDDERVLRKEVFTILPSEQA